MSTDVSSELELTGLTPAALGRKISAWEKRRVPTVTLTASAADLEVIGETLCALRASGLSALLFLRREGEQHSVGGILRLLSFLREWDQLLLRNVLELASTRIPAKYQAALQQESKIEMKWFQEWQTAVADPRIHQYPGLPWRSFLRKVNAENYAFSENLLQETDSEKLDRLVQAFLQGKKKTICVFPKNWGKK